MVSFAVFAYLLLDPMRMIFPPNEVVSQSLFQNSLQLQPLWFPNWHGSCLQLSFIIRYPLIMISSLPTVIMVSSPLLSDLSLSYIKHNQVILPYIAIATLCTYLRFLWYIYIDTQLWFSVLRLQINITDLIEFPQFNASPEWPPHHMSMSNSYYLCTRKTICDNHSK